MLNCFQDLVVTPSHYIVKLPKVCLRYPPPPRQTQIIVAPPLPREFFLDPFMMGNERSKSQSLQKHVSFRVHKLQNIMTKLQNYKHIPIRKLEI